jgi:hypothetical protein
VDEHTISPAGDPFYAAPHHDQDERPHACDDGWVTIGQIAVDPETARVDRGRDLLRRVRRVGKTRRPRYLASLRSGPLRRVRTPPACSLVGKPTPCLPSAEPPGQSFQTFGQSWGVEPPHSPYNPLIEGSPFSPSSPAVLFLRTPLASLRGRPYIRQSRRS